MEIKELRVGNLVMLHNPKYRLLESDKIHTVLEVRENAAMVTISGSNNEYGQYYEFLKAIPISEEILLKVGFEFTESNNRYGWYLEISKNRCLCWCHSSEIQLEFIKNDSDYNYSLFDFDCKHLHQLQNLYFALTGSDLDTSKIL